MTSFIHQGDYNNPIGNGNKTTPILSSTTSTTSTSSPSSKDNHSINSNNNNNQGSIKKIKILQWLENFKRKDNPSSSTTTTSPSSSSTSLILLKNSSQTQQQLQQQHEKVLSHLLNSLNNTGSNNSSTSSNTSIHNGNNVTSNVNNSCIDIDGNGGMNVDDLNTSSSLSYSSSSTHSNPSSPVCTSPAGGQTINPHAMALGAAVANLQTTNLVSYYTSSSFDTPPIPFPSCPRPTPPSTPTSTPVNRPSTITIGISKQLNNPTSTTSTTSSTTPSPNIKQQSTPDRDVVMKTEMKATKENFYKTVGDPKSFMKFKTYMENCQSMENLNFYLEIERYKKIDEEMERRFTAGDIWRRFFEEGGSNQLGLESAQKRWVEANKSIPTRELFDEVQNQVLEDMVCDAYRHFLSSPFNQEWRVQPTQQHHQLQQINNHNNNQQQQQSNIMNSPSQLSYQQQIKQQQQQQQIVLSPGTISASVSTGNIYEQSSISSPVHHSSGSTVASPPNQLSISGEHPELDISDIQFILDEVVKNNISIHNEIHYSDVSVSHWIASGASGRVYCGLWKGKEVAVKVFGHELNVYFDEAEYKREVAMMTILKHDNLVQCFGSGSYGNCYFHLTEYCPRGSLTDYLKLQTNPLDLNIQLAFALDIAYGMKYLHSIGIIHRDLKSMNVLLTENSRLKIIDFGSSRIFNKQMTCHVGTQAWMAPEVFTSKHYTEKVDVYSFGIILWEIFTRRAPYEENVPFNTPFKVAKGERPDLPKETPPYIANLIKKCWSHKPSHRPSFIKICSYLESNIIEYPNNGNKKI